MRCYNHPDKNAIAVCRSCGKAVCHQCAQETENAIACRQECVNALADNRQFQVGLAAHFNNIKRLNMVGSFFSLIMSFLFIYFSFLGSGIVYDFILLLGLGFLIYGLIAMLINLVILYRTKRHTCP